MSFFLILVVSLFFSGVVSRVKSVAQGRRGPSVLQPMFDVAKLLRKGAVLPKTGGFVFRCAPSVYLASVLVAAMVAPVADFGNFVGFPGDFVFFAYALALGKFFTILAALDTGSSFEGMGASREALLSMLVEPAFFTLIGTLGLINGVTDFATIFARFHLEGVYTYAIAVLVASVLLMVCMIENSRMPIDDPKTHLELTMIHEVMVLDNSGVDLAFIQMASHVKFALYGALISSLFIGDLPTAPLRLAAFVGIELLCAVVVGMVESFMARYRMVHNAQFALALTSLALLLYFGVK